MAKKVVSLFLFLSLLPVLSLVAQDPQFSQFYANPLYLNPALTGAPICPRLLANYRNQWPSVEKAFVTYNASYDQYVDFLHGGVGLLFTADRAGGGNLNTTMISLLYAYKFNITSRIYASAGVQVTYYQRRLVWENLLFEDMIDPQNGFIWPTSEKEPDRQRVGVPDFSAGVFLGYEDLIYGGISVSHLTQPDIGFYADANALLYMKITVHAGSVINLRKGGTVDEDKEFSISPNILYQQQFNYHQLNLGLYFSYYPFVAGLWFRHNFENADAVIPFIGVHYKNLRVGYSYDFTVSNLKGASGGAHEVSASWQFPCIEKRRHIRAIKCPGF
ncbi:MAG: type IX secretion system membrane protein PorP/SprF [Bacteroidetes bacterium]|nr:MAG: type IX secretion system membrane protein PorP/SprF [Bacteroidota bacterium]